MSDTPEPETRATIRRAPKLSMFLLIGGALGAIVTFVLTALFPVDPLVGFGPLLGYFMLYGIPAGVVLGAAVGLTLDWRSRRRASDVSVEHETVIEAEAVTEAVTEPEPEAAADLEPDPGPAVGADPAPDSPPGNPER